jgi:hypothetical protein
MERMARTLFSLAGGRTCMMQIVYAVGTLLYGALTLSALLVVSMMSNNSAGVSLTLVAMAAAYVSMAIGTMFGFDDNDTIRNRGVYWNIGLMLISVILGALALLSNM